MECDNSMDSFAKFKVEWSRSVVLNLIELWQTKEILYNTQHDMYHNKHAKAEAIEEIRKELEAVCPEVQAQDIKTKLKNLRTQYAREKARVVESSHKSGSSTDDLYVPRPFWFQHMSFLNNFMQSREGSDNLV